MSVNDNNQTIAEKQQQLQALLAWFDSDEFVIEQVSEKFEQARRLSEEIERSLEEQKNTITVLKEKFSNNS